MRASIPSRLLVLTSLAVLAGAAFAQQAPATAAKPPVTLKVGDAAPPLKISKWIKGQPVPSLTDGTVHVVEFWATWCGPCKSSMPHLSKLAERYRGKATFIGVNVWESRGADRNHGADLEKATQFVGHAGDVMDYTVAMDTAEDETSKAWLTAAGQNGIPASFVVDGKGTILWIGHPQVGLEEVVELAVQGKLDVETGQRVKTEVRAKFNEFYALNKAYADAIKAGDYKAAYEAGDKAAKLIPSITDPISMKIGALIHTDRPAARTLARTVLKEYRREPLFLASVSRTLLDDNAPGATKEDFDLGLELIQAAATRFAPDDLSILPTLALAYHKTGQRDQAVKAQTRYVELISAPDLKVPADFVEQAKGRLTEFKGTK
ncbi:MAG: redoxin family protein [Fimbriimonas sp.]